MFNKVIESSEEAGADQQVFQYLLGKCNSNMRPLRTFLTHLTTPNSIRPSFTSKLLPTPGDSMCLPLPAEAPTEGEKEEKEKIEKES